MRKSKCNKICAVCGEENVIFFGKQNGKQRYKCKNKDCKAVFTDNPKFTCERSPKRAMTVLLNLLNNHSYTAKDISIAFNKMKDDSKVKDINKIRIDTKFVDKKYESDEEFTINCYNPKLLICADDNVITFFPLPSAIYENIDNKKIDKNDDNKCKINQRKITIIDSEAYKGLKSNLQQTYINRS